MELENQNDVDDAVSKMSGFDINGKNLRVERRDPNPDPDREWRPGMKGKGRRFFGSRPRVAGPGRKGKGRSRPRVAGPGRKGKGRFFLDPDREWRPGMKGKGRRFLAIPSCVWQVRAGRARVGTIREWQVRAGRARVRVPGPGRKGNGRRRFLVNGGGEGGREVFSGESARGGWWEGYVVGWTRWRYEGGVDLAFAPK